MDIPAELKYISPYIQRGQELSQREPVIAYYAQFYAARLALSKGPRTKETNEYLSHLLDSLEAQKKTIGENETITNDLVGYAHVENFALKIFLNADNEDRAGKASKKTAKTFLAASIFLELLKTFGELDPEVEAKIKYAKWKATDITKALRDGRTPQIGSPFDQQEDQQEEQQDSQLDTIQSDHVPPISEFPSPPSDFATPSLATSDAGIVEPPSIPTVTAPTVAPVPAPTLNTNIPSAQKHAKWAISALEYDDMKTARLELLSALNDLGFNRENNFGFLQSPLDSIFQNMILIDMTVHQQVALVP